jgi:hypothetical protein
MNATAIFIIGVVGLLSAFAFHDIRQAFHIQTEDAYTSLIGGVAFAVLAIVLAVVALIVWLV